MIVASWQKGVPKHEREIFKNAFTPVGPATAHREKILWVEDSIAHARSETAGDRRATAGLFKTGL